MSSIKKELWISIWLLGCLLLSKPSMALADQILPVLYIGDQTAPSQTLLSTLQQGAKARWDLEPGDTRFTLLLIFSQGDDSVDTNQHNTLNGSRNSGGLSIDEACQQVAAVVTLGLPATRWALSHCDTPLLSVLVSQTQLDTLRAEFHPQAFSAITLEADPALNLRLITAALGESVSVGVFISEQTLAEWERLEAIAAALDIKLVPLRADDDEQAVRRLRQQLQQLGALLLLADESLINAWSLKPILLMTARQFVPVFGGSTESYVKAGVTAAVVADVERLPAQINRLVLQLIQGNAPMSAYPAATKITINPAVAQALSIDVDRLTADE